tara:strand:+ start:628 stop:987 length:360 start_codon:yes stop_codon:yes gene_type:complete
MARTKSSRGIKPFKLRSGNSPMNFGMGLLGSSQMFNLFDKLRKKKNKLSGETGEEETLGGKLDAINTKLDNLSSGGGNNIGNTGGLVSNVGDTVTQAKEAAANLTGGDSEEEEILEKEV